MSQRTPSEGDAADGLTALQRPDLGGDATFAQVGQQQAEAPKLEIAFEDAPDPGRLGLVDGDLAIAGVVAKRDHAADPEPLALGGRNLVADALGGHFPFELGKRQQDVERQPTHGGGGVELLRDRDEGHAVPVKELNELGKICQRAGQPVDLVHYNDIDFARAHIIEQPLQRGSVGIAAGEPTIAVVAPQ